MDQITQERIFPPSVSHSPSTIRGQVETGQSLNSIPAASKPLLVNTFLMLATLLSVIFTVGFAVLILSTVAGLRLGNTLLRPSPFVALEAVWPGQSITSLSAYARQTPRGTLPCLTGASPQRDYVGLEARVAVGAYTALGQAIKCADYPNDGLFRTVGLTIESDRIQQLKLYSDVLPQDVLLFYWGIPDTITQSGNPQVVQLVWDRSTYWAMASVLKSDSVVKLLTITAKK